MDTTEKTLSTNLDKIYDLQRQVYARNSALMLLTNSSAGDSKDQDSKNFGQ